jgi:hypothetical protein
MPDYVALKKKVDELAEREWDTPAIEARIRKLSKEGIPKKKLDPEELLANKQQILDRVQLRAEEYFFVFRNCTQATALALMEEFGLGSMEIIKALTPFPGISGPGELCRGIIGSTITLGLLFGNDDPLDSEANGLTIMNAQKFRALFKEAIGHNHCGDIIETVIIGYRLDPGESEESTTTFAKEKGFEKCSLLPGISARIAAELIIDSFK